MPPTALLLSISVTDGFSGESGSRGIYWSLALPHCKHYGDPVLTKSQEQDRLTSEQMHMVALGALLQQWNVVPGAYLSAAQWFVALWGCLAQPDGQKLQWLRIIVEAAERLLNSKWEQERANRYLLDFGYSRGKRLLNTGHKNETCLP
jgi:hypothetical protein